MEEQIQIVTFDNDQAQVEEELPVSTRIPTMPTIAHADYHNHSVVSFLQRPQLLSSFRWVSSSQRSVNLFRPRTSDTGGLRIPSEMINRSMIRNKLDGFTSFKATAVIKLQINAQPFQCGRLLMAAAPMPSLLGHRKDFIFTHVSNAQNLNHVQMDIAKDTEVVLRVPFISPYNCYDLIDGRFDWAELQILVYSPLLAVSSTCVECLVFGHFEDIELGAPTSGEMIVQQSASPGAVNGARKRESQGRLTGALASIGNSLVSKGLSAVSPLLGAGDAILAAAGWSKPILSQPNQVVLNRPNEGFGHMDGVDQSLVLAMTSGNAVENIPNLVGTGIDETDFHRLKRIPQMIGVFSYSDNIETSAGMCPPPGTKPGGQVKELLWSCAVAPTCNVPACYALRPVADDNADPPDSAILNPYNLNWKQPTTLNYISSPFLYWTGSLVYTFKFVKTDYHSGRVEIAFHPFINNVEPPNNSNWLRSRMDYVYRTVVDLRKNSEVSVTIPYIAAQPWKRISTYLDPINANPPVPGRAKDIITGILTVRALTPLICSNAIISPTIEVLVEMRAGDDYECQGPITSKFLPFSFGNVDIPKIPPPSAAILSRNKRVADNSEEDICQQSGAATLRTPATQGFIYGTLNNIDREMEVIFKGLESYDMVWLDVYGSIVNKRQNVNSYVRYAIPTSWDGGPTPMTFASRGNDNHVQYGVGLRNPGSDELRINYKLLDTTLGTGVDRTDVQVLIDLNVYPLEPYDAVVRIDPEQLPLPTAPNTGGGGGGVIKIDPSQWPLQVVNHPEKEFTVKFTEPVLAEVQNFRDQSLNVQVTNTPLPVTGLGGGAPGGVVSIDPNQLPLWVSEYNVAPSDPRDPGVLRARLSDEEYAEVLDKGFISVLKEPFSTDLDVDEDIVQQSGDNDKVATAGVTETRTRALEGWMPPCITGNEIDAHRPSTAQWCAGERFTTFRQYSRRFAFSLVSGLDAANMLKVQPIELVRPGILAMRTTKNDSTAPGNDRTQYALYAPNTGAEVSGSPLSFVAGMYAFYRGSTRFKVWMDPRENPPNLISGHLEYARQLGDVNIIDDNIENFMTPIMFETPQSKQIAEFQVPYYSPTIVSSTWSHGIDNQFDVPLCNLVVSIPDVRGTSNPFPIKIAVAAGDDMDFHQFIGPPPVMVVNDILTVGRQLHYPPTGFTPTQKVPKDTARTEAPATAFRRVLWTWLSVSGNPSGSSCPLPAGYRSITLSNEDQVVNDKPVGVVDPKTFVPTYYGVPPDAKVTTLMDKDYYKYNSTRRRRHVIDTTSDESGVDEVDDLKVRTRKLLSMADYYDDDTQNFNLD